MTAKAGPTIDARALWLVGRIVEKPNLAGRYQRLAMMVVEEFGVGVSTGESTVTRAYELAKASGVAIAPSKGIRARTGFGSRPRARRS